MTKKFFSVITKSSNMKILTENLVTLKKISCSEGLKDEKPQYFWGPLLNLTFRGWGVFRKTNIQRGIAYKKGLEQFANLRGEGLARKWGAGFLTWLARHDRFYVYPDPRNNCLRIINFNLMLTVIYWVLFLQLSLFYPTNIGFKLVMDSNCGSCWYIWERMDFCIVQCCYKCGISIKCYECHCSYLASKQFDWL